MLKSAIVASVSIASLLSIATIADARSIDHQSKSYLIAKESNSTAKIPTRNISESDLKGIHQAISARYQGKNQILENTSTNSRRFYEVKVLKLVSFSNTQAKIKIEENIRNYQVLNSRGTSFQNRDFQKAPGSEYTKHIFDVNLEKSAGKWRINYRSK